MISLETNTKTAPNIQEMNLFIYGDQHQQTILAVVRVEIYAMVSVYTKVLAGVTQEQSLSLPVDRPRVV